MAERLLSMSINETQFAELSALLGSDRAQKAAESAIRKTLTKGYNLIVRKVVDRLGIDRKGAMGDRSRPAILARMVRAQGSGGARGYITIVQRAIRAIKFDNVSLKGIVRPGPTGGIRMAFQPGRSIQLRTAFVGTAKFQGGTTRAIFVRERIPKDHRLPIRQVYGPSILRLMQKEELTELGREVVKAMEGFLGEALLSQIDRMLDRRKADRPETPEISGLGESLAAVEVA